MMTWLGKDRRGRIAIAVALAVAALAMLQARISFRQARDIDDPGNYDTAYYYTVARNLAMGRGVSESMVWHYLGPETPIVRPAGDCWMVGWPILLGTLMVGFGHSGPDALRICAGLSILVPVLVFRVAWQVRSRVGTSLLAGLLVCGQSRLYQSNVTPDVTLSYQILILFGLGSALKAWREDGSMLRWAWVGLVLGLPMWVRGEGFVGLMTLILTLLVGGKGGLRAKLTRVVWFVSGAIVGVAPLYGYHLVAFGKLNPDPRSLTFWLRENRELYLIGSDPTFRLWLSQGFGVIASLRVERLGLAAYQILIQVAWPLLLMASLGIVVGLVKRRVEVACLSLFLVLSATVPALLVPFFANPERLVMHALPILCILAASAVGEVVDGLRGSRWWVRSLALGITGLLAAGCVLVPARLNSQGHFEHGWKAQFRPIPSHLATATQDLKLQPDDVILTQDPWQLAAVLDVRTVMIPYDGPSALKRVIDDYQPRLVLLPVESSKDANPTLAPGYPEDRRILGELGFREVLSSGVYRWYERPGQRGDR